MCKKALIITDGDLDYISLIENYYAQNIHVTLCFQVKDGNKYTFEQFKFYIQSVYPDLIRNNMLVVTHVDFLDIQ